MCGFGIRKVKIFAAFGLGSALSLSMVWLFLKRTLSAFHARARTIRFGNILVTSIAHLEFAKTRPACGTRQIIPGRSDCLVVGIPLIEYLDAIFATSSAIRLAFAECMKVVSGVVFVAR